MTYFLPVCNSSCVTNVRKVRLPVEVMWHPFLAASLDFGSSWFENLSLFFTQVEVRSANPTTGSSGVKAARFSGCGASTVELGTALLQS